MFEQWRNFNEGNWVKEIDVRDFIQKTMLLMKEMTLF